MTAEEEEEDEKEWPCLLCCLLPAGWVIGPRWLGGLQTWLAWLAASWLGD